MPRTRNDGSKIIPYKIGDTNTFLCLWAEAYHGKKSLAQFTKMVKDEFDSDQEKGAVFDTEKCRMKMIRLISRIQNAKKTNPNVVVPKHLKDSAPEDKNAVFTGYKF